MRRSKKNPKTESRPKLVQQKGESTEPDYKVRGRAVEAHWVAKFEKAELSTQERAFLGACLEIHRRDTGTTSPFENFIWNLVWDAMWGHWPTPEDAEEALKEFQENWEHVTESSLDFARAYPNQAADILKKAEEERACAPA